MASQDWFEKDFYAVLGVAPDADAKEIKKVYRKLAREHHPDSKPGDKTAEQRFKEIGEAYAVLSDAEQRKQYDAVRAMSHGGARFSAGSGGPGGGAGFEDIFSNLFGAGGQAPGGTRFTYSTGGPGRTGGGGFPGGTTGGAGSPDLEDLLSMFGGGGAPGRGGGGFGGFGDTGFRAPAKGRDRQATAVLSFRQAVVGDVVEVRGTDGTTSRARIPAGVKDGATIRIRGKGDPGPSGTPPGDLLIKITVRPHGLFRRDGDDLTVDVPVTFAEATLGETISVPTFGGSPVKVRLPAGTQSGKILRVKGRGVPFKDGHGDLLVRVSIVVPQRLSDEAKAAVEVLREEESGIDVRADVFRRAQGE